MKRTLVVFCCHLLGPMCGVALAQALPLSNPQIQVTISDELVLSPKEVRPIIRDGHGDLVTRPGDQIQYTLAATNLGDEPAYEVELLDPIPKGTEYVIGSATGEGVVFFYSIDGGHSYQESTPTYDLQLPDGTIEKEPARAEMYSHVKWRFTHPIQPGASEAVILRVRVEDRQTSAGTPER